MKTLLLLPVSIIALHLNAQDTFSICAFDPLTGEVGSAGATCIESSSVSCIIISDVHPGVGVVHTQSYWLQQNQELGYDMMLENLSAQQIIDSLVMYDAEDNPDVRQYGVVRVDNNGSTASFTGNACYDYKNHITGPNYAIQGNILLGQQILDSMETRFLNTDGNLACKLMAAMQGAKVVGADTRCEDNGTSSFSAFIRVAQQDDDYNELSLDISVNTYSEGTEPIDSLQTLFEAAGGCPLSIEENSEKVIFSIRDLGDEIILIHTAPIDEVKILDAQGKLVVERKNCSSLQCVIDVRSINHGMYSVRLVTGGEMMVQKWVRR